jgi:hypothetical protein
MSGNRRSRRLVWTLAVAGTAVTLRATRVRHHGLGRPFARPQSTSITVIMPDSACSRM